jgi:hypothetical protein
MRRACTNLEVRKALLAAMKTGVRYRMTKAGVIFYGDNGLCATAHFTISDRRGSKNLWSQLEKIGVRKES